MAYKREPLILFETLSDTGIDELPVNSLVTVESSDKIWKLDNTSGLTSSTTLQQAIDAENLIGFDITNEVKKTIGSTFLFDKKFFGGI